MRVADAPPTGKPTSPKAWTPGSLEGKQMKILKIMAALLGGLAVLTVLGLLAAAWIYRDIPAAELEARYLAPTSRFMNIDGVRLHYRDEGSGPVLVLIHANFSNLIDWDPVVAELVADHRVIRFDMPSHGLTGPDPSGDYSLPRTVALTERFVDALGLERFSIGGTSLGGTVSIHYASRHPDRIERLVLLSPGALEGRSQARRGLPDAARVLEYILPRALPEFMLRSAYGDPTRVPEEMIDRWHDMWLREGQRKAQLDRLAQYESGDLEGVAGADPGADPAAVGGGKSAGGGGPGLRAGKNDDQRGLAADDHLSRHRAHGLPGGGTRNRPRYPGLAQRRAGYPVPDQARG